MLNIYAQFGAVKAKADFDACNKLTTGLQHDCIVLHAIQRARTQAPLHLPHKFFDVKRFYKILPLLPIVIAKARLNAPGISSPHAIFLRRLGDLVSAKKATGGGVCKVLCQKSMCGRWELERALDDVFGI